MSLTTFSVALLLYTLSISIQTSAAENKLARGQYKAGIRPGFNDDIDWVSIDDAKKVAEDENKPVMLLIHKSWCGACKALKPQVASSRAIQKLSEHFVMVNTEDEEEPQGSQYSPDGGYIPRVLFLDPKWNVVKDIYNEQGSASYKYYYPSAESLEDGMKRAKAHFEKASLTPDKEL